MALPWTVDSACLRHLTNFYTDFSSNFAGNPGVVEPLLFFETVSGSSKLVALVLEVFRIEQHLTKVSHWSFTNLLQSFVSLKVLLHIEDCHPLLVCHFHFLDSSPWHRLFEHRLLLWWDILRVVFGFGGRLSVVEVVASFEEVRQCALLHLCLIVIIKVKELEVSVSRLKTYVMTVTLFCN